MDLKRFTEIVESYGANTDRWPTNERKSAEEFYPTSADATRLLKQEAELDQQLSVFKLPGNQDSIARSKTQILKRLRPEPLERLVSWALPDFDNLVRTLWRPVLAASMPLIFGIAIGVGVPASEAFELTTDEEFNLLGMAAGEEWNDE